jgi:hypothetical protein
MDKNHQEWREAPVDTLDRKQRIIKYRIKEQIGQGSEGTVFRCVSVSTSRFRTAFRFLVVGPTMPAASISNANHSKSS